MEPTDETWRDIECITCHKLMAMSQSGLDKWGDKLKCWDCVMAENQKLRGGIREMVANVHPVTQRKDIFEIRITKAFLDILTALLKKEEK